MSHSDYVSNAYINEDIDAYINENMYIEMDRAVYKVEDK